MSGGQYRLGFLAAMAAVLLVGPVWAEDSAAPGTTDKVARLEALLEAQQRKVDALEQQLAAAAQQDTDKARVEQMKQQIREVLSEKEFRESLMPSTVQAGYDKGFYIKSSDDKFMLKFQGCFQFRWTYYNTQRQNRYLAPGFDFPRDRSGFDWNRNRFKFLGNVYSKDLTYFLELDSSSSANLDTALLYSYINYRFTREDEFQMRFGTFRLASTRADFGSTQDMQFPDYPYMNAVFGLVRGTGVRFWGKLFDKKLDYYLDVVNTLVRGDTQTITNDEDLFTNGHDNSPAVVFRTVWHALTGECRTPADDPANHFITPADIEFHTSPALDFGFHYAFTQEEYSGTMRIPFPRKTFFREGGFGLTSSDGLQINQFGWDAAFKFMGFSTSGEYVVRIQDVTAGSHAPFAPLYQFTGDGSTNAQQGAYVQCGYFLPIPGLEQKLEAVARVGGISALAGGQEGTWDYGAGLNYYIHGNKVKLQTDVSKIYEAPISGSSYTVANVNDDVLFWRVQLQVAF